MNEKNANKKRTEKRGLYLERSRLPTEKYYVGDVWQNEKGAWTGVSAIAKPRKNPADGDYCKRVYGESEAHAAALLANYYCEEKCLFSVDKNEEKEDQFLMVWGEPGQKHRKVLRCLQKFRFKR